VIGIDAHGVDVESDTGRERITASTVLWAAGVAASPLIKTLGVEWACHNIRVNGIAPGLIVTPRVPDTPELRGRMKRSLVPMGRAGETDDIGHATLFLASDLSGYVTGHTLPVDGGWMAANVVFRPQGLV